VLLEVQAYCTVDFTIVSLNITNDPFVFTVQRTLSWLIQGMCAEGNVDMRFIMKGS